MCQVPHTEGCIIENPTWAGFCDSSAPPPGPVRIVPGRTEETTLQLFSRNFMFIKFMVSG
jgi:hypothetical protein